MEEIKIIEENKKKKNKEVKEIKNEETLNKKIKLTIEFKSMTSRQIVKLAGKPKEGFYYNKKELCSLLEKQGYTIKY